jgi:NADH-quinone oxidoreductase subunit L
MANANQYTEAFEWLLVVSLVLPLLSAVFSVLITDRYAWGVSFIASLLMLISAIAAAYVSSQVWGNVPYLIKWNWFSVGGFTFSVGIYLNQHAALLLFLVSFISFLVHVYSTGYMAADDGIRKYFSVLGFFTFSMLVLAVADNLLLIFFFWELVGFSSYLLIGHWNEKPAAAAAATKAFLFNRIGDAGFLIGLMVIWNQTNTFDIVSLSQMPIDSWSTVASLCIFCGVIGKSAQFPLFTWLPDAMEGPTPVSALIHAATMVAAGIYLLARVAFLFTPEAMGVVTVVGIATALLAALAALAQHDIKKILAYSTISQLGLMVTAMGVGAIDAALIHLFAHAFFKACLFLGAGSVIHTLHRSQQQSPVHFDVQDIRNLGGLKKRLPFTFLAFVLSGSSLAGVPFFSGFLSKDAILASALRGGTWLAVLVMIVSFITVLYTFRMIWKVFMGEEKQTKSLAIAEAPVVMRWPMGLLMIASFWFVISWTPFDYMGWLFHALHPGKIFHFNFIVLLSAVWVFVALYVAYRTRDKVLTAQVLLQSFYLDKVYRIVIAKPVLSMGEVVAQTDKKLIDGVIHAAAYAQVTIANLTGWFDRAFVDGTVNLLARIAQGAGSLIRSFQEGKIQLYIFWASLAIIIFLIWTLF